MTDERLTAIGDETIDLVARTYPSVATQIGIHRGEEEPGGHIQDYDAELGSFTASTMEAFASSVRGLRARVGEDDTVDAGFLRHFLDSLLLEAEGTRWWQRSPEFHVGAALDSMFFMMEREYATAVRRARAMEARLRQLPAFLAEARETLRDTPRVVTETAITSAREGEAFARNVIPAWAHEHSLSIKTETAADALAAHAAWLEDEYLERSNAPAGVGDELLARIISTNHMLSDSADDIARRGDEMIARLSEEITEIARDLGFADWRTAVTEIKKDTPSEDELIEAYAEAMRRTQQQTAEHSLATEAPDAPLQVRATPAHWRHTVPYAAYSAPAAFEDAQRGIFWVTPPDGDAEKLKDHPWPSLAITALHEGYPGHHLQLTRANRHPSRIRRLADSALFIEGWAFYCEELGWEQGLLSPQNRLFQLKDEIWRACRIVIDMRMNQGSMTPAEAVDMLVREADLERPNAEGEVRRYAMSPGYQMAYAIGKQEILALRKKVQTAQGANFSLRAFHDTVLDQGSMPVALIERAILH